VLPQILLPSLEVTFGKRRRVWDANEFLAKEKEIGGGFVSSGSSSECWVGGGGTESD